VKPKNPALAGLFGERWTRTQRIRTAAAIPVETVIVDRTELPVYLRIAEKAKQLRELGMSDRAIAEALGVSDKTVAKAVEARRGQNLR
jgi:CRP-like cAMP-binding protein